MLKKLILIFSVIFISAAAAWAQSSCSCELGNGGCKASQSCPAGYIASCTCSASGCTSSCNLENLGEVASGDIFSSLKNNDLRTLNRDLSRAYGKVVRFSLTDASREVKEIPAFSVRPYDWSILEFLDQTGDLTINGHKLSFWRTMRESLLKGDEFQICSNRADAVLNEISFLSGKKFSVVAGDAATPLKEPIRGKGLYALLSNLSEVADITIVQN